MLCNTSHTLTRTHVTSTWPSLQAMNLVVIGASCYLKSTWPNMRIFTTRLVRGQYSSVSRREQQSIKTYLLMNTYKWLQLCIHDELLACSWMPHTQTQQLPIVCSRSLCIRKWWAEFFRWIFIDIPPKVHNCGSRYALTWRESLERAWAARAETPIQHVWHFAAILPRLLNCCLYSFSSFLSKIRWHWRSQLKFWR